jgi:ubiquinone/menaquinone biosynthesis C-methylase UbiE
LEAYRLLAPRYDRQPNPLLALSRRTLPGLFPALPGKLVLDVAAGTGYWAAWCWSSGARAIAVDLCWEMLEQAPRPAVLADALRLPLPDGLAHVTVCSFGLGYAPGSFAELARVTRPGGAVIACDLHPAAIERGWTRSFRVGGEVFDVAAERYALETLRAPGLERELLWEPRFGEAERPLFEQAGKSADFDAAAAHPAIFAARWRRL